MATKKANEIAEYQDIIQGIYRNYQKKPEQYKIQLLLQNTLKFGIALGKEMILQEQEVFRKKGN